MKRSAAAATVLALALVTTVSHGGEARAEEKRITLVRLESHVEIAAGSPQVWAHLTRGADLATCWPVWSAPENAGRVLAAPGDRLAFTDEWGNGGLSIVTFVAEGKELRIADEPDDGSYICQTRFLLEAAGANRTILTWVESYSDESPAEDQAATAAKVRAGMEKTLAEFASLAGKS
jgi:hypothetical protein